MAIYGAIWPDGCLKSGDMPQLVRERWIPLAAYQKDGKTYVLFFDDPKIGEAFVKRNFPGQMTGLALLSRSDLEWMDQQGWLCRMQSYAQKYSQPHFCYVIHELQGNPHLFVRKNGPLFPENAAVESESKT